MIKIKLDKARGSWGYNVVFGFAAILDGLIRVFSFGALYTTATLDAARWWARRRLSKLRERRQREGW